MKIIMSKEERKIRKEIRELVDQAMATNDKTEYTMIISKIRLLTETLVKLEPVKQKPQSTINITDIITATMSLASVAIIVDHEKVEAVTSKALMFVKGAK